MRRKARGLLTKAAAVGAVAAWANCGWAQVSFTGATYTQNFDTMTNTTEAPYPAALNPLNAAPVNASGLNGWSMFKTGGSGVTTYVYNDGTDTRIGLLGSFGVNGAAPVTDRAIGSTSSSTTSIHEFGVVFVNNTSQVLTKISVGFDVEWWRRNTQSDFAGGNTTQVAVGGPGLAINSGTFTTIPDLLWNPFDVTASAPPAGPLDGNADAFRQSRSVSDFAIPAWAPGQFLALRWVDGNDAGADDIMGIDNFSFTATGTGANQLTWNRLTAAGGTWDQDTNNKAWLNGVTPAAFQNNDVVTFPNTAIQVPVTVDPGGVAPLAIFVNNTNAAGGYTFNGGPIIGELSKSGAGKLVLATPNAFTTFTSTGGTVETQQNGTFGNAIVALGNTTWRVTTQAQQYNLQTFNFSGTSTISTDVDLDLTAATLNVPAGSLLIMENHGVNPLLVGDMPGITGTLQVKSGTVKYGLNADGDFLPDAGILQVDAGATVDLGINGDSFGGIQGGGKIILSNTPGSFLNLRGGGTRTFSGIIEGTTVNTTSLGLNEEGGGTVILTGQSTFDAPTSIRNGTIVVGADVKLNQPGPLGAPQTFSPQIRLGTTSIANSAASLLVNGPFVFERPILTVASTNTVTLTIGGNADANILFSGDIELGKSSRLTSVSTGTNAVTFSGLILAPADQSVHGITKVGSGLVVLTSTNHTYLGGTTVNEGILRVTGSIATSSGVTVTPGSTNVTSAVFEAGATQLIKTLTVNSGGIARVTRAATPGAPATVLTIGDGTAAGSPVTLQSTGTNTGKIDLRNNGVVVDFAPGNETAAVQLLRGAVVSGYNGGNWGGAGVTSTNAAADPSKAIGYALASEVLPGLNGTFMGKTGIDDSSVVVRYTLAGDATLDGAVDFNDLVKLAQSYNTTVSATTESWWTHGDFTYDGLVDFNDLVKLAQNYNTALPAEGVPGASAAFNGDLARAFAEVPEPTGLAFLGVGAAWFGRRRRRG